MKATHQGQLDLMGTKISCAVLEDGTRILVDRSVATALGKKGGGAYWESKKKGEIVLPEYISASYLSSYISHELREKLNNPIPYINTSGNETVGIDAILLPQICDVWISAKNSGGLTEQQQITAEKAYLLMKAFAVVGITALIDEATGYQYDREKDELQKILKKYISEELLPWQKKFPDIYYQELFRLNQWDFTVNGIKKRPSCIGKWTNTIIYKQLPQDVLKTLKEQTPKSDKGNRVHRFHQLLTLDIGEPHLNAQINQVLALFRVADTMEEFWKLFEKMERRKSGQLELPFKFDSKGHTIAPTEEDTLSDFNKKLKKGLAYSEK